MLSLQKCRTLLGTDCKLTDAELEQVRQALYALSDVAIEVFCAQKNSGSGNGSHSRAASENFSLIPSTEREAVEERAAILEYQAGLKTPEAERTAFGEWIRSKRLARGSSIRKRRNKKRP